MPHFSFVDMRYHQKDAENFCGEAVAQMILAHVGVKLERDQQFCFNSRVGNPQGLNPDQLLSLLNAGSKGFTCRPDTCPEVGIRRICAALKETACPVATLVASGEHWVAVSGAAFDRDPAQCDPEILGFFIDNPEPQVPDALPPGVELKLPQPHALDDSCGYDFDYFGSANTFVTMHEWLNWQWNVGRGSGNSQAWVSIPRDEGTSALLGSVAREAFAPAPGRPKDEAHLYQLARDGIALYGLDQPDSPLKAAKLSAVKFEGYLVVATIPDRPSNNTSERFFLVTARGDDGHEKAHIRIGEDGRFLSVQAPATFIPRKQELHDLAASALAQFEAENGLLRDSYFGGRRAFTVHPNLVWKPCRQSMSPFQPFVQINLAGTMLFVGMDGRVHPKLEPHVKPGRTAKLRPGDRSGRD